MNQLAGICYDAVTRVLGCTRVHVGYAFKLKRNLTSLQGKWSQLQDIHQDVESKINVEITAEMQRTSEVNSWLQQVQNLQQIIEDIEAHGSKEIRNTCICGCCPKNYLSSYKIGRRVAEKSLEVDELLIFGRHFLDKNVPVAQRLVPNSVDEMPTGDIIGLDLMLDKVWKSLNDDDNIGIIGLYGMGGAGKTTLLKRVHNELGKKEHMFELVLWVVVSKDWNINKIMNDIRNCLKIEDDFWSKSSNDQRTARVYRVLKQKRFLLMLDDLWGKLELESVGVPHPKEVNCQSKIVLTTRNEDVCVKMHADMKIKVERLHENEAFNLFCKKVGEETLKCHSEIPKIAREMANECGGLPLALITVGSAMAGEKSVATWRHAKNDLRSFPLTSSNLEDKVFSILKFSFDKLPDEAHKNCFLYCALYPEDYEIGVEKLIDRWIGEGFLGKGKRYLSRKSIYDMRDEGRSIIEKLKLSSLLEDASLDDFLVTTIKMHDVIRDMALWLACNLDDEKTHNFLVGKEALTLDSERLNHVEMISLIGVEGTWQEVPTCPNLITLCAQSDFYIHGFSNLQFMTRLKVLDLSYNRHIKYLPIEVGKLVNLEFLNLSHSSIAGALPIELKNLQRLRVFLIEGTQNEIPLEVFDGLKQLLVFRCWSLSSITKEKEETLLEKLESLTELEELCAYIKTMSGMHKLFNSKKFQCCLRKFSLDRVQERLEMASLLGSWSTMKHLECIFLNSLPDIREVSPITPRTYHLDKLRELVIYGCYSITHLTWLRYAPLLESLRVSHCSSVEEVVKGDQEGEDEAGNDNVGNDDLFSNLKVLKLFHLSKLKSIHKRALPFPSLKNIYVRDCLELRKLPLNSNSTKDNLVKIIGEEIWWNNLEWEDLAAKDLFHTKFVG